MNRLGTKLGTLPSWRIFAPPQQRLSSQIAVLIQWWARRDLNPQPRDYESPALTVELQAPYCQ